MSPPSRRHVFASSEKVVQLEDTKQKRETSNRSNILSVGSEENVMPEEIKVAQSAICSLDLSMYMFAKNASSLYALYNGAYMVSKVCR